ncbi:hypothetical protein [Streptomyces sp. NPDC005799]|uniref:hypothetical protein n=1 Tax=Streptomyces sp. NPDC005799 TaxID=3154678 RepID=UPI00340845A5
MALQQAAPAAHPRLSSQLSPAHLRFAVLLWEQALLGIKPDDMSVAYGSDLADLFASIEPELVQVWGHIRRGPHAVDADG